MSIWEEAGGNGNRRTIKIKKEAVDPKTLPTKTVNSNHQVSRGKP